MRSVRCVAAGMLAAMSFAVVSPASAQQGRTAAVRLEVQDFDVEQVVRLGVGTPLVFSVFATPGATVAVAIDGAAQMLELAEVGPGVYEGTYTVAAGDRIAADGRVVATLRRAGVVKQAVLQEPLVIGTAPPRQPPLLAAVPGPQSLPESVDTRAPQHLPTLVGTPVPQQAPMIAASPSLQHGSPRDFPVSLPRPIAGPAPIATVAASCGDCAVVESIVRVGAEEGFPDRMGARAGGVAGTVFGERIGQAHARHVRRVFGALGGVFGGRSGEGRQVRHDVVLRLPDGSSRERRYDDAPPFRVGETIRLGAGVEVPSSATPN